MFVESIDKGAEPAVPDSALEGCDVDTAKVLAYECQGSFEIGGVIDEIGYNATTVGTIEDGFAFLPLIPIRSQYFFLFLFARAIVGILFGQCKIKSAFVVGFAPMQSDPFSGESEGAEALVIEVVHCTERLQPSGTLIEAGAEGGLDFAKFDFEAVCRDIFCVKWMADLPEVFHPHGPILEACLWTIEYGEVLGGRGVSILKSAVADLMSGDVPATEDFGDGFWGAETLFVQLVECMWTGGGFYIRDFFDPEVFRGAF